ncbi:hypothetical protein H4R35_006514 [Dimargaris xerosporica]|nr:hypothetical protein H4R35_006514 [Dimargaris xerosporica]
MHKSKSGKGRDPRMLGQTLKQTLVHLETQIKRLDEAGIRHIIVFNLPNISQTPALSQRLAAKKQQIRNNFTRKTSQPTARESDSDYDTDVEDTLTASFDDDDNDDEVMWPKEVASNSPNFQTLGRRHFRLHSRYPSGRSGAQSPIPKTVSLLHPEILTESDEAYDADDEAETKPKKSLKSRTKKLFTKAKPKLEKSVAKVQSMFTDSVNKVAAGATGLFVNAAFQGIKWVVEREINIFNDRLVDTVNSYNQQYPRDTPILVFDVNALFNRLRRTDMDTSTACLHMDEMGNPTGVCEDPDNTLFFDQVHMTTRAHKMLASDVKDAMTQSHMLLSRNSAEQDQQQ